MSTGTSYQSPPGAWNQWGTGSPTMGDLFSTASLSPTAKSHVTRVYGALGVCGVLSAVGASVSPFNNPLVPFALSFLSLLGVTLMRPGKENDGMRYGLLGSFALFKGMVLSPLLLHLLDMYPSVVTSALMTTVILFASLSASAALSSRRLGMYMGALIGALTAVLSFTLLAQLFLGSQFMATTELFLGLFLFSAYVIYDTQLMLGKVERGILDVPGDAAQLYVDMVAIFIRVAILLAKQRDEQHGRRGGGGHGHRQGRSKRH
ncbi:inhibitor of apoptosis-promoting Bax1-domain-containing protein [Piptocephalis cylindrospora]|uniref:Inhibitor of apoptosis-promoting Bax1-domain-containing protein n=1 Tax=Piptocephalis cylindrospora TaxID=1907219 RepID=A0A4P9Y479_9FUNG|nr:inhibitor of apoptosis-promoting Bax1-domain-containing protein [Piptocephalis cylindrospora]|eukprot:RKP13778.1 inhibitor of apoptosis-promoting Bax1-domain-containing protein [Piptocephalis cylindrospora]